MCFVISSIFCLSFNSLLLLTVGRPRNPCRVSFKPGDLFSHSGALRNCCRVVVAHYDTETLVRGINILCDVIESEFAFAKRSTPMEKDPTKENAVFMG